MIQQFRAGTTSGTWLIAGCGYTGVRLARRRLCEGLLLALVRRTASAENLLREGIPALAVDFDQEAPAVPWHPPSDLGALVYPAPPSGRGTEDLGLARFFGALG